MCLLTTPSGSIEKSRENGREHIRHHYVVDAFFFRIADMPRSMNGARSVCSHKLALITTVSLLSIALYWYLAGTSSSFVSINLGRSLQEASLFTQIRPKFMDLEYLAAIVELRTTPMLVTIVLNVIQNIPANWPIQIFHGESNAPFIKRSRLVALIDSGKIILTELNDYEGDFNNFTNMLFTSIPFWEQVRAKKVLFFQIDSVMCSNSPHKITDYLQYDFVGAPWTHLEPNVGNGGFSLRSKNKTLALLRSMHDVGVRYSGEVNEDVWYSIHLSRVGLIAPKNVSRTFSVETIFYEHPLGVHKAGINKTELKKLCAACPEARLIPPYCV